MLYLHSFLDCTEVNGPGKRIGIWFQGCTLGCKDCWNPQTHKTVNMEYNGAYIDNVIEKIIIAKSKYKDIEGITFSGGEPLQQMSSLEYLIETIKTSGTSDINSLSIGLFSGYSMAEADAGIPIQIYEIQTRIESYKRSWAEIKKHLDWAVMGRYVPKLQSNKLPLIGSSNQQLHLLTGRYKVEDFNPQETEFAISDSGLITITGFPPEDLISSFDRQV